MFQISKGNKEQEHLEEEIIQEQIEPGLIAEQIEEVLHRDEIQEVFEETIAEGDLIYFCFDKAEPQNAEVRETIER